MFKHLKALYTGGGQKKVAPVKNGLPIVHNGYK